MTILWSDIVGYPRIILGLSSNRLSIGGSIQGVTAETWSFQISWQAHYLVRLEGHFVWQAQYLVRLVGDFS